MRESKCRLMAVLMCLVVLLAMVLPIYAVDEERNASLNVVCCLDETPLPGMTVQIFQVAVWTEEDTFQPISPFSSYPVEDVNDLDTAGWRRLASTLESFVAAENLAPNYTLTVDATGNAGLEDVPQGLYLMVYGMTAVDGVYYTSDPVLVAVPNRDENGAWNYDVTAKAKPAEAVTSRKVMKIWKQDDADARPESITIRLLQKGLDSTEWTAYGEDIVLNQENSWQYAWEKLPEGYSWQVQEVSVPTGYTVAVEQQGTTLTVTNTGKTPTPDKPTPEDKLPKTGTTWYLVPILAAIGLMCLLVGALRCRNE